MKKILIFTLLLFPLFLFAKPQPLASTIKKVTVFIEGGQVTREASTHLPQGKTELVISGLSKYLDPKSIRVKGIGDFTVLAIHNELDFLDKEGSSENDLLRKQVKDIQRQIKILQLENQSLTEKQAFLTENKKVAGSNTPVSYADYNQYYKLYSDEIHQILLKRNEIDIQINDLQIQLYDLANQLNEIADQERKGFYKIRIFAQADRAMPAKFEISYYVGNCGWFPTYDIRIENLNEPVNLSYKANLRQSTGVDWKDVFLTFSNASPTDAGDVPELNPFYLGEAHSVRRSNRPTRVMGVVMDSDGKPLYGASVIVAGTTIGTATDYNGRYDLMVPVGNQYLEVTYVGFKTTQQMVSSKNMNIVLQDDVLLDEVVVTAMGIKRESKRLPAKALDGIIGSVSGVHVSKDKRKETSKIVEMDVSTNTTSLEFEVKVPYTVLSKPKSKVIEMRNFDMPASYQYQIVPKIEEAAYLMAFVPDWEQYQLMDGESNLYFENTYVGKALIEATSVKDTLKLSLGRDKSISVTRTNVKDRSNSRLLGSKKVVRKAWKIEVKNNKSIPIKIVVMDQIPVSRKKKIAVEDVEFGDAQFDKVTGKLSWETEIAPYSKKEFHHNYTVKYPKGWNLRVD